MPRRLRVFFKGLYRTLGDYGQFVLSGKAATLVYGQITSWVVGNRTFQQGQAQSFDISTTGPSGYTVGGIYGVDPLSSQLPSGLVLAPNGVIQDTGAAAATQSGVVFTYHEPGALPTLTLYNGTVTGTLPYMATVYPAEGAVPSGQILVSSDDSTLRSSVLSTWPDNSAQVVVLAGNWTFASQNTTGTVSLKPGVSTGTTLNVITIQAAISSISVNFGSVQTLSNAQLSSPDRTWWANPQVICARYRLATGLGSVEAVIDIHAFANGRAFVEVVVENGKVDSSLGTVTGPTSQTYTNATVSVNGTTITTVSSPANGGAIPNSRRGGNYTGGHEPYRAWYCSGWIGGDPLVEVTHDAASMQAHPLFFKAAEVSTESLQTKYAQSYDSYVPWATCRLRSPGMDGGGDDEQIAHYTEEQANYFQTGNRYARRAVLATGLACHSFAFNWRDITTSSVPTYAQVNGKQTNDGGSGTWPITQTEPRYGGNNTFDGSHIPSVAVVPFLCRPSPCFIDLAWKEMAWNLTNYGGNDGRHSYDQIRSRAWRLRNYGSAIFLTPDIEVARKTDYRTALYNNLTDINFMLDESWNSLGIIMGLSPGSYVDHSNSRARFQQPLWMHHFCVFSFHAIDKAKVLRTTQATDWATMVDRMAAQPIRFINESTGGEWRLINQYSSTVGDVTVGTPGNAQALSMSANWGTNTRTAYTGTSPASVSGNWLFDATDTITDWTQVQEYGPTVVAGNTAVYPNYDCWFWDAFCCAVERDISGASTAWAKVNANITNLSTWRTGFRTYPRSNRYPRNV